MKKIIVTAIVVFFLTACHGQNKEALKKAKEIETVVNENRPESVPTANEVWTLTAKINGKSWKASSMTPPEIADRIIGYYKEESIGLPFSKNMLVEGNITEFGEFKAADLTLDDDVIFWVGGKGQMQITKSEGPWVEGIFKFTAASSSTEETKAVTDGFFRIKTR